METGALLIFFCIFGFLGLVFLLIGLLLQAHSRKKTVLCTQRTTATVTDNIRKVHDRIGEGPSFYWYPVVRYYASGRDIETTLSSGRAGAPRYQPGTSVTVLYQPDKPENCFIEGDNTLRLVCTVFLCVGIGLLLLALIVGYLLFSLL